MRDWRAPRPPLDPPLAAARAEELLKSRGRDLLTLADPGQRDRAIVLAQRQIVDSFATSGVKG